MGGYRSRNLLALIVTIYELIITDIIIKHCFIIHIHISFAALLIYGRPISNHYHATLGNVFDRRIVMVMLRISTSTFFTIEFKHHCSLISLCHGCFVFWRKSYTLIVFADFFLATTFFGVVFLGDL